MEHEQWAARIREAADLHEAGDLSGADEIWQELIPLTPTDLDRSVLLVNRARTLTALGRLHEAETSFDLAIAAESAWFRGFARAHKGAWLSEQGRGDEAAAMFEALAGERWVSWSERIGYRQNAAVLRGA
jgi:hypothetical protein